VGYLAGSASGICVLHSVVTGIRKETVVMYLRPLSQRPAGGTPMLMTQTICIQMAAYLTLRLQGVLGT